MRRNIGSESSASEKPLEEEVDPDYTEERLLKLTVKDLKEICQNRGLLVSGTKAELTERIIAESEADESSYSKEYLEA